MKPSMPLAVTALLGLLMMAGCGASGQGIAAPTKVPSKTSAKTHPPASKSKTPNPPALPADPKPMTGNELGVVPILEYHSIGPTEGRWQRTPQGLEQDLAWLDDHHFTLVTMQQYESGDLNIPKGTHPAVLTFDDGDPSQFQWTSTHVPTPTSAVGVLEAFHNAHPDFPVTATFYINDRPFGTDSVPKMQWLVAHGFELGNHTFTHADINSLGAAGIEQEIGEEQAYIEQSVPGYVPVSFALPYGGLPQDATDRAAVLSGTYHGTSWHFLGVALVGASPAASPFSKGFSVSIPRIQVCDPSLVAKSTSHFILWGYEQEFMRSPSMLYTSDGSDHWISFPAKSANELNRAYSARANPWQPASAAPAASSSDQ